MRLQALLIAAALAVAVGLFVACTPAPAATGVVIVLQARGEINSVMAGYLGRNINAAQAAGAAAVVIQLDTPGGLDSSMRQIIQRMNASPVPIIVYVSPPGARAASAGTFITEAAALAAMAPGTNIGAASPVSAGGADINGTEGKKVTNDAVAFIRSLAQEHGRNADWAESAVRQASALPTNEARAQNVVDVVAADVPSLLSQADGKTVRVAAADTQLQTQGRVTLVRNKSLAERILDVISDPNIAFLLLTLGGLALAFEVIHPTIFTGAFGVILFVTGLFALGSLPTNWAGVALILLAFGLLVADVYAGGVGVLAAGGITALVIGGLLLVGGSGASPEVSRWLVFAVAAAIAVLFIGGISALFRSRRRPSVVGEQTLIGRQAVVRSALDPTGYVSVGGENWKARVGEGRAEPGEPVTILAVRGLELDVQRLQPAEVSQSSEVAPQG
ncbi:MAG TPA: NfeD family protein [Dehalococcoidia bacterium]|nr:NfeD family protein [Dehalococcoidia bacterium]